MIPEAKGGYLSADKIREAFRALDIELTNDQFEYLIMNIYEYTGNLKKLDYGKIFEIFQTEEHKRMKQMMGLYEQDEEYEEDHSDEERDKKVKFEDQSTS